MVANWLPMASKWYPHAVQWLPTRFQRLSKISLQMVSNGCSDGSHCPTHLPTVSNIVQFMSMVSKRTPHPNGFHIYSKRVPITSEWIPKVSWTWFPAGVRRFPTCAHWLPTCCEGFPNGVQIIFKLFSNCVQVVSTWCPVLIQWFPHAFQVVSSWILMVSNWCQVGALSACLRARIRLIEPRGECRRSLSSASDILQVRCSACSRTSRPLEPLKTFGNNRETTWHILCVVWVMDEFSIPHRAHNTRLAPDIF